MTGTKPPFSNLQSRRKHHVMDAGRFCLFY